MATHSSILAWRIPGMAEPGGLPSMGSHRVGHDWSNLAAAAYIYIYTYIYVCIYIYLRFCPKDLFTGSPKERGYKLLVSLLSWLLMHDLEWGYMLSSGALILPSECESSSSLAQSIPDHRCTVPLSNLHGLCSCPSIQGPGRNCQLPIAYLSASGRTETLLDYWQHKRKGVKNKS